MIEKRIKYPGVSEVFGHYTKSSYAGLTIDEIIKLEEKHNYVKRRCLAIANEIWNIEEENEYSSYVDSFNRWFTLNVSKVIVSDILLFDDVNRFTGKIDMICITKDHPEDLTSVTIKTSYPSKSWDLQLAAYRQLCDSNVPCTGIVSRNIALKLSKKGDIAAEFESKDIDSSWEVFKNILQGWHYFKGD